MTRLLALLLLVQAGASSAASLASPPLMISAAEAIRLRDAGRIDPVYQVDTDGQLHLIGFILEGVTDQRAAGAYAFAPSLGSYYIEFHATRGGVRFGSATIPVSADLTREQRSRLRGVIPAVYTHLCTSHAAEAARAQAARAAASAPTQSHTPRATEAAPRSPDVQRPSIPQPTRVKPTFLDRALLATSSRVAALWDEHRYVSILTFVFLGCVLGARVRTRGPRPIEVRQDDVLAALSVSERRLAASRARLQQLSSAIDAEEGQFIQRVSAIVARR